MKFASIAALAASFAVADSQYLNLENKYYGNDNSTDTTTTESANNPYMAKYIAEMLAVFMGELIYLNRLENIEDCVVNG